MPNTTLAANAQAMPEEPFHATPEGLAARFKWEVAYSEWLAAKAAAYDPTADESDAAATARYSRREAAELALIATPAPLPWALLQKIEFVEQMMSDTFEAGEPAYPLASLALASVRTDFMALRIKD